MCLSFDTSPIRANNPVNTIFFSVLMVFPIDLLYLIVFLQMEVLHRLRYPMFY